MYIIPQDRNQLTFMSSIEDLIPSEHPVRLIENLIESIVDNNRAEYIKEKQITGRPSYHPKTMLKLYIYGYLNGISSSRKLEIETIRNKETEDN